MARKTHANSDLGIDPRRVDGLTRALPGDIRQVTPIDVRRRPSPHDLDRAEHRRRRALSSTCPNPVPLGSNRLLELRVRDLEAVLCGQLDTHAPEPLISADGEHAPLLGAQLEGGEDAFPSVAVVDVDLLTAVREGGGAALADATIVDVPTFDDRGERADILGRGAREGRPLYARRSSFSMSPPLREPVIPLAKPFFVAREPSPILVRYPALQPLAIKLLGLFLRLTAGEQIPGRVEESAPSLPRSAEDVCSLLPMTSGHAFPIFPLLLHLPFPSAEAL
jgi:hypothetical protein